MNLPFAHLHCHSHYSLLDGTGTIPALLTRTKELGMTALALTDHGNLYGALEFYCKSQEFGIKPIIGYEAYVAPGSRFEKSLAPTTKDSHLTLLAMNQVGYKNLLKLSSLAFLEGFYYRPRIDKSLLETYHEGLICLSGCSASELSHVLLEGEIDRARNIVSWYKNLFGDRYYIEIQNNGLDFQKVIYEESVKLAKELGIPTVATNDIHYVNKEDAKTHDILLCISTGKLLADENRIRLDGDQFYLRSGQEMLITMPGQEDAIARTMEIAERVNVELELGKRFFPSFTPPKNMSSFQFLKKLCFKGLKKRYRNNPKRFKDGKLSDEVIARLKRELKVIKKQGFSNYFLIVWDIVREAEARSIYRTARGSAAGSLICYALNMSQVCPLEFGLLFERFLNENRREPPDIDLEFDADRRGEILEYAMEKYGADNVAQIGTFGKRHARMTIKDVGRVLGISISDIESITKLLPGIALCIKIRDMLEESPEMQKRYEAEPEIAELIDNALKLDGLVCQSGTHACALVLADKPLIEHLPLQNFKDSWKQSKINIVTQWAMGDVVAAGLLKMDFLGLRNLSLLAQTIGNIEQSTGQKVNPYEFPLDDKKTFDLISRGDTKGIFQMESDGMRDLLQRLKPDCFRDIIAIIALYRPGPIESGMVDQYIDVKHGRKKAEYLHPVLEEVLGETYGVMVYQEQVMRILNRLGNTSLGDAYTCIKKIYKEEEKDEVEKYRQQFIEGGATYGVSKDESNSIFELIIEFAPYGFIKSHAVAFTLIAYMTAYLKTHYPTEYADAYDQGKPYIARLINT